MVAKFMAYPWMASLLLQAVLMVVVLVKRIGKRFPIFVTYCISNILLGFSSYAVHAIASKSVFYFCLYWTKEGIGLLLGLAVLYEIFKHLFAPYAALRKLASLFFRGTVALLLFLTVIIVYFQPLALHPLVKQLGGLEQAGRLLEVGLLLFLFLFAGAFGLHWRQYAFGIALGLGVFVAVELVGLTMWLQFGNPAHSVLSAVRTISFNSSLL